MTKTDGEEVSNWSCVGGGDRMKGCWRRTEAVGGWMKGSESVAPIRCLGGGGGGGQRLESVGFRVCSLWSSPLPKFVETVVSQYMHTDTQYHTQ